MTVEMNERPASYHFGRFEVLPTERVLRVDGKETPLTPRAFDLLVALVERGGRLVSKNELLDLVWPHLVVEENNIQVQISVLRKLLGPQAIATVPGLGYRFALREGEVDQSPARVPLPEEAAAALSPGNLPAQLPPLYGRNDDVIALGRLLERHRVISVVGPGGIGKTRVALAVAHGLRGCYPDGVWLVQVAPLVDPLLVVPTVARVLGHVLASTGAVLDSLVEAMQGQRLLLVLDNCEHLLGAVAELVARIAAGAPGVRMLVTSQEPLRVLDEQVDRLKPLTVPTEADVASALNYGAVELFVARAQGADPRFALNGDNVDAVVEICTRLDGIALAIELAAARISLLGVQGLRQRLDERLKLLAGGVRGALPRHQTLQAALEWSYALLSAEERAVFDRLGVFTGSFSLEAAQQVASRDSIDAWSVLDHLAALIDKSLVLTEGGNPPRYRLLESSHTFALERLARGGATEATRRRHAEAIAETLGGGSTIEGPEARMHRIGPDLDNVRAAAAWATGPTGDRQLAIALAGATHFLWEAHGFNDEGDRLYRCVEPWVDESTPPRSAARFWYAVSDLRLLSRVGHQAAAGLRAADLFRGLGDQDGVFGALLSAAHAFSYLGKRVEAEKALAEAKTLLDPSWPLWKQANLEYRLGIYEFFVPRSPERARQHYEAALTVCRRAGGEGYFEEVSELHLLLVEYALREFESAVARGREILHRPAARMGAWTRAIVLLVVGAALAGLGNLEEAEATLRSAFPKLKRATGSTNWAFNHAVLLVARQGRLEDAARLIGYIDVSRTAETVAQSPSQRRSYDEALEIIRPLLGVKTLEQLRAAGCKLTEEEATALAFPAAK